MQHRSIITIALAFAAILACGHSKPAPTRPEDAVHKIGPNNFQVDRAALKSLPGGFQSIMKEADIVENKQGGAMLGYRLFRIRPWSVWHMLELRNGDAITHFDGRPIRTKDDMYELYKKLEDGKEPITLMVQRQANRFRTTVHMQD